MFTPTKYEIEELGFVSDGMHDFYSGTYEIFNGYGIKYIEGYPECPFSIEQYGLYPQSIEDIQTLIRLLSPNN